MTTHHDSLPTLQDQIDHWMDSVDHYSNSERAAARALVDDLIDRIAELEAAIETHHRTTHMYDGADITDELRAEREMWALVGLEPDPDAI